MSYGNYIAPIDTKARGHISIVRSIFWQMLARERPGAFASLAEEPLHRLRTSHPLDEEGKTIGTLLNVHIPDLTVLQSIQDWKTAWGLRESCMRGVTLLMRAGFDDPGAAPPLWMYRTFKWITFLALDQLEYWHKADEPPDLTAVASRFYLQEPELDAAAPPLIWSLARTEGGNISEPIAGTGLDEAIKQGNHLRRNAFPHLPETEPPLVDQFPPEELQFIVEVTPHFRFVDAWFVTLQEKRDAARIRIREDFRQCIGDKVPRFVDLALSNYLDHIESHDGGSKLRTAYKDEHYETLIRRVVPTAPNGEGMSWLDAEGEGNAQKTARQLGHFIGLQLPGSFDDD